MSSLVPSSIDWLPLYLPSFSVVGPTADVDFDLDPTDSRCASSLFASKFTEEQKLNCYFKVI